MPRRNLSRRQFVAATALSSAALITAPYVRGAYAAGTLSIGMWDHWVPDANKASTNLVRRFDIIAIEDLNVYGMVRNRSLARAIACTGWAEFRSMLDYKAQRYGRSID